MNNKFKPVKSKRDYGKEFKKWSDKYIDQYSISLFINVLLFNTCIHCFIAKLVFAIVIFLCSEKTIRSLIAYSACSFLLWKAEIAVHGMDDMFLYFACLVVGYLIFRFVIMLVCFMVELYVDLMMWLIKSKIKDRFPLSKEELEECGVHDRYDCLIYFQYMMHGFGKFKKVVFRFEDCKEISSWDLMKIFYNFNMTSSAKEKVEAAKKANLIEKRTAETIYERPYYSFWSTDRSNQDFIRMLSDCDRLYEKEMNKTR